MPCPRFHRASWLAPALLLAVLLCSPALALTLDKGFHDVPWGADVAKLGFTQIGVKGDATFHQDKAATYLVAGTTVRRVVYGAVRGKVFAVYVDLESPQALAEVKEHFTRLLGPPSTRAQGAEMQWEWRKGEVRVACKEEPGKTRKLAIYHQPLAKGVNLSIFQKEADARHDQPILWGSGQSNSTPLAIPLLPF